MNPHELLKHTYSGADPSEDFTERVLRAAQETTKAKRRLRFPRSALIAAILVLSLALTAAATGSLKTWLAGVVEIGDGEALKAARTGELLLERDTNGMHVDYGQFLCVGRFLYMEIEITKDDGSDVTWEDLVSVSFDDMHACGLTLDYDDTYQHGKYDVCGEGYIGYSFRHDDGQKPGYAHYTLAWTLSRHDYAGKTLHVQLWEPYEWVENEDGTQTAINEENRQLLAQTDILRETPADEERFFLENGDEVRICAFGAEVQGKDMIKAAEDFFQQTAQDGEPKLWEACGVLLADGTRIPFNPNVNAGVWHELDSKDHWSAFPFSITINPTQAVAIYFGDELWTLHR